jgi:hypothetical protein
MRLALILEASGSSGSKFRVEITLGLVALGWLLGYFGT